MSAAAAAAPLAPAAPLVRAPPLAGATTRGTREPPRPPQPAAAPAAAPVAAPAAALSPLRVRLLVASFAGGVLLAALAALGHGRLHEAHVVLASVPGAPNRAADLFSHALAGAGALFASADARGAGSFGDLENAKAVAAAEADDLESADAATAPSIAPSSTPSSAPETDDAAWARAVAFRAWDAVPRDAPALCDNAQRSIRPVPDGPLQMCGLNANFSSLYASGWQTIMGDLLRVDCQYAGFAGQRREYFSLPSRNASVYIVFATSAPVVDTALSVRRSRPYETPAVRAVRRAHVRWTLARLRVQFGAALELTVVQLDDEPPDEERDFGRGVVNTLVWNATGEGQDWGMYAEGLHAAWHRLDAFDWVLVMNDQMVGPIAHLPDVLDLARGAALWVTSSMTTCCVRGFLLGFSRALVATRSWRDYWMRMHFPCGKWGPMLLGEAGITLSPHTQWQQYGGCATSTRQALGKKFTLAFQRGTASPFLYRWGTEDAFFPALATAQGEDEVAPGIAALVAYLDAARIPAHVEDCALQAAVGVDTPAVPGGDRAPRESGAARRAAARAAWGDAVAWAAARADEPGFIESHGAA